MEVKVFNSMTNQLEVFKPLVENEVSMYVCGPTVYNYPHIGNLRPVISFDLWRRLFERLGYKVTHMSNITDIDDKIIKEAIKEGVSEKEITDKYEKNFFEVIQAVGCKIPTHVPHATATIPNMVIFIQRLIDEGYAYEVDGDVYFRVAKVKDYGILNHFNPDDLKVGARIEENTKKENPLDFALWKKTEVGIKFPAPFGEGRPGWHTECVVMIQNYYPSARIDIHGGGFDLKFPHHENEIAQAKAIFGHNIANYWMHNGFINIDNVKMSKSIGNVLLAKDLVEQYGGALVRMVMLESHYRAPLNFNDEVLTNASNDLNKITSAVKNASIQLQLSSYKSDEENEERMNEFLSALANDLNTSNAITVVFNTLKELNMAIRQKSMENISKILNTVNDMLNVLGLEIPSVVLSDEDKELFNKWNEFRAAKDFANADVIRNKLLEKGLI